ncbi:MAG: DMT family transporter [Paracoccaceae bacterium]
MDNLRGAALMTFSMLGFAIEDMVIKLMAGALPVGEIIALLGLGGAIVYSAVLTVQGRPLFSRALLNPVIAIRSIGEIFGTIGFVTAIVLTPLSSASAILQATPLAVTLGAALFLQEKVGWRRWSATLIGFCGVLLIIRPGLDGFDLNSLFAVQGVIGLGIRDLATRKVPKSTSSMQISFLAFITLIPTGMILLQATGGKFVMPDPDLWLLIGAATTMGTISYYAIVAAMRVGDVGFVTPFRYTRLLFAMAIGIVVFAERPDLLTMLGSAIVVCSGVFVVWRERKQRAYS